jgi:hypothetical protein
MPNLSNWDEWKETLAGAINLGETVGMSDKAITKVAEKVGTYLANNVEPRNDQERLLKEMWAVADTKEKDTIANLIIRISDT